MNDRPAVVPALKHRNTLVLPGTEYGTCAFASVLNFERRSRDPVVTPNIWPDLQMFTCNTLV